MTSISLRSLRVELCASDPETVTRADRRIVLNTDLLKASKVFSGDVIALSKYDSSKSHDHKARTFSLSPLRSLVPCGSGSTDLISVIVSKFFSKVDLLLL